jgi:hypothetical protein
MQAREITQENKERDVQITQLITDEYLRDRIRELIDQPKPAPWWQRLLKNPLFLLILTFVLTNVVGNRLANNYNSKQAELEYQRNINLKELESERSFADELNKIRLSKLAEAWEKVYLYEAAVEDVMQQVKVRSDAPREGAVVVPSGLDLKKVNEQSRSLHKEVLDVLSKNRLWLEDDTYYKLKEYADIILDYYFAVQSGQDFEKWKEKRDQARDSINQIREKMLKR